MCNPQFSAVRHFCLPLKLFEHESNSDSGTVICEKTGPDNFVQKEMYFKVVLKKIVYAQPEDLGPAIRRKLERYLRSDVEGKRLSDVGLVIAVVDILDGANIEGKVLDTGAVSFAIKYVAVVFKLLKDEVVDGVVSEVRPDALVVGLGATNVYISKRQMPANYVYESDGAVSRFVTHSGDRMVSRGSVVRLRIISETAATAGIGAVGSIDGPYLGPRE